MKQRLNFLIATLLLTVCMTANADDRSKLSPTPPMGWMTWNYYQTNINEQLIRDVADIMVNEGYRDAGYTYIFIDDLWQGGRDNRNNILADPKKFPHGIKALADYVHKKGLKLGIYSDAAQLTCGGLTASYGFEEQDAKTFAEWGIDYLKYDYCHAPSDQAVARERYGTMAKALSNSGRDIVFGVCEWGSLQPWLWARQIGGQQWRTSGDVRDLWTDATKHLGAMGILDIANVTEKLSQYAGPGHWNDMDMLVIGLRGKGGPSSEYGGTGCTDNEYQSQMSLWCMMGSPLQMSHNLKETTQKDKEILLNKEIIAIDQDPLGKTASCVKEENGWKIYLRPLSDNRYALAILNTAEKKRHYKLNFSTVGLTGKFSVRDIWKHKTLSNKAKGWSGDVDVHETKVFVLGK